MNLSEAAYELNEIQRLEGHTGKVWCVDWKSSTGINGVPALLASCGGDMTVRIWEQSLSTGSFHCKAVLEGRHSGTVRSCAWFPTLNTVASASFDGTTAVWDFNEDDNQYEWVTALVGHENEVKSVTHDPSGLLLATCGRDKTIWVWEVLNGNDFECLDILKGHTQDVKMVQWHPHLNLVFSCSYDKSIKVWAGDYEHYVWDCVQTITEADNGHSSTVWALSFNANGNKMVTCSDDLTIKIWGADIEEIRSADEYAPWTHLYTLSGYHDRTIFSVHWSRDGIIATGAADNAICLFIESDNDSGNGPTYELLLKKSNAHDMDVNCVQWSSVENSGLLASASDDGKVKIWKLVQVQVESKKRGRHDKS